jgi:electron transport complex protein RnfA
MIQLAGLAVFSGLSLNLLLQFALGTADVADDIQKNHDVKSKKEIPYIQFAILFVAIFFLWVFFNEILPGFFRGFSEYFLFFPLSALICIGLEFLGDQLILRLSNGSGTSSQGIKFVGLKKTFRAFTAYDGLIPAAMMISSIVAGSAGEAFVLAIFFAAGNLMAMIILDEIRRRSTLELIPRHLRGKPLIIISMGLLSLIFTSAAGICFKILEAF